MCHAYIHSHTVLASACLCPFFMGQYSEIGVSLQLCLPLFISFGKSSEYLNIYLLKNVCIKLSMTLCCNKNSSRNSIAANENTSILTYMKCVVYQHRFVSIQIISRFFFSVISDTDKG